MPTLELRNPRFRTARRLIGARLAEAAACPHVLSESNFQLRKCNTKKRKNKGLTGVYGLFRQCNKFPKRPRNHTKSCSDTTIPPQRLICPQPRIGENLGSLTGLGAE